MADDLHSWQKKKKSMGFSNYMDSFFLFFVFFFNGQGEQLNHLPSVLVLDKQGTYGMVKNGIYGTGGTFFSFFFLLLYILLEG